MKILLATTNPGKRDEILAAFDSSAAAAGTDAVPQVDLITLADLDADYDEPEEHGRTFEANALLKARGYAEQTGMITLADDSGLEVDALAGEPGVRSARYSGAAGPRGDVDLANNAHLLARLGQTPPEQRTARFVCAMALVVPLGADEARGVSMHDAAARRDAETKDPDLLALVRGTIEGRILLPEEAADPASPERGRGENGFGYDPLFLVPDLGRTTAELAPEHKNRISHRGNAARLLWRELLRMQAG